MIKNIPLLLIALVLTHIPLHAGHPTNQLTYRSLAKKDNLPIDDKGKEPKDKHNFIDRANDLITKRIGAQPDVQTLLQTHFNEHVEAIDTNPLFAAIATSRNVFLWDHHRNTLSPLSDDHDRNPNEQFRSVACLPNCVIVGSTQGVFRIDDEGTIHKAPFVYGNGERIKNVSLTTDGKAAIIATNKQVLSWLLQANSIETLPLQLMPNETIQVASANIIATSARLLQLTQHGYTRLASTPVTEPIKTVAMHNNVVTLTTPNRICTYHPENRFVKQLFVCEPEEQIVGAQNIDDTLYIATNKRALLHQPSWENLLKQLTSEQKQLIERASPLWQEDTSYTICLQDRACYQSLPLPLHNPELFNDKDISHITVDQSGGIEFTSKNSHTFIFNAQLLKKSMVLSAYIQHETQDETSENRYKHATRWLFEDCSDKEIHLLLNVLTDDPTRALQSIKNTEDIIWLLHRADMFAIDDLLQACAKKLAHSATDLNHPLLHEHLQKRILDMLSVSDLEYTISQMDRYAYHNNALKKSYLSSEAPIPTSSYALKPSTFNHNRTQQFFRTQYKAEIRHSDGTVQIAPLPEQNLSRIDDFNDNIIATTFGYHPLLAYIITNDYMHTWDIERNELTSSKHQNNGRARSAHTTKNNKKLVVHFDEQVTIHDLATGNTQNLLSLDKKCGISHTNYDAQHDITAIITPEGITLCDHTQNDALFVIPADQLTAQGVRPASITSTQLSKNKQHLLLGTKSNSFGKRYAVIIWDIPHQTIHKKLALSDEKNCHAYYRNNESEIIVYTPLITYTWKHNYYSEIIGMLNFNQKALLHRAYAQWTQTERYTLNHHELACYHSLPAQLRTKELFVINHETVKTLQAQPIKDIHRAKQN